MLTATITKLEPESGSCLATIQVRGESEDDPCVFVVRRLKETDVGDPTELVSVASPADMDAYGTAETSETLYRTDEISIAANSKEKLTELLTALTEDLKEIGEYIKNPDADSEEVTIESSAEASGPFVFGDMGVLAEEDEE